MQFPLSLKRLRFALFVLIFLSVLANTSRGQSLDIAVPTPVRSNEIIGTIGARDLGDARRTDHFYTFAGTPGDVLITVRGNNLNGDVDVFTVAGLRPLLKFTLYAESTTPVTKSIYLRRREELILRVEARTPNDDEGTYQIRLGGSYELIVREGLIASADAVPESGTAETPSRAGTRRVTSVGARIPEPPKPPEEIAAAAPTPEPTPEPSPVETPASEPTPDRSPEAEAPKTPPRSSRSRPTGRRRPPAATTRTETTTPAETATQPKVDEPAKTEPEAASGGRRAGRRGTATRSAEVPAEPEPQTGPRLIIELQDGTRVERYMNTVRRVTVDNNQIVVVSKLGRIERIQMADIVRMSIEP